MRVPFLLLFSLCFAAGLTAQPIIDIRIDTPQKATISFLKGDQPAKYEELDFKNGDGKLRITNATTVPYKVTFIDESNSPSVFPGDKFPKVGADKKPVTASFNIDKNGKIENVSNSALTPILSIKIEGGSPSKEMANFRSTILPDTKPDPIPRRAGSANTPGKIQNALYEYVQNQIRANDYLYVSSQNIIIDNKGTIHIYLDQNLSPVYAYFPTTAKEGYDRFQFHILSTTDYTYTIESSGKFDPKPIGDDIAGGGFPKIQSSGTTKVFEYPSAIFGPFTGNFPFLIQRYKDGKPDLELERTIRLLSVSRVSLDVGLVATWLRNPKNIAIYTNTVGDSTLVADNPDVRGMLTAMLTFHFKPRNLNIPPRTFNERLGLSVGVPFNERLGSNFFFGLNLEAANGLFINGGVHFGEVNYPINHEEFDYGKERFSGTLVTKTRWDARPYLAVSVDAALFVKAFSALFTQGAAVPK